MCFLVIIMLVIIVAVIIMRIGMMFMAFVMMLGDLVMLRFRMVLAIIRLLDVGEGRRLGVGVLDDLALNAIIMAAAARAAVARAASAGTILVLLLGLAVGALVGLDQGLTVGDRDLVIVGMNFRKGEEAMAVAAIFDKGRLQRRLYPRDLGEVDIATQLLALGGFEIKFFDAIAADHDDPGLFRVGGIDQHLVGHFLALGGGGRVGPSALGARSADATVHLIRG